MPGGFRRKRAREEQRVRVDGNGLMRAVIGDGGLGDEDLAALILGLDERAAALEQRRSALAALLSAKGELRKTLQLAAELRSSFDEIVVLASGGTALGIRALAAALAPPTRETAAFRLTIADRLDPSGFAALLARLDLRRTLFDVISENGDALPTLGHFLIIRDRLLQELGALEYQRHVVITTGLGESPLRQIVHDEGFRDLAAPPDHAEDGALLSAGALFPLACAGVDVGEIAAGALDMVDRSRRRDDAMSPAQLVAAGLTHAGSPRVLAPSALRDLATWTECRCGADDAARPGAADGIVTAALTIFLGVERAERELEIPKTYQDIEAIGYLGGQGLATLAAHEQEAEAMALWSAGHPTMTLLCPEITPHAMGQLVGLVDAATTLAGTARTAAPEATRLAYGLAGRPGFEAERAEVQRLAARREARYVV